MVMPNSFVKSLRTSMTDAEARLWFLLRDRRLQGFKFRRQMSIGAYVADFVCLQARLIVELDGGQHAEQTDKDKARDEWLKSQGFAVLRFWNNDVQANTGGVLQAILEHCESLPPHPCPSPAGGEGSLEVAPAEGKKAAASADHLRRLRWRCRRGLLELDLWLRRFADTCLDSLSEEDCTAFERLLQEADADLLAWLEGHQAAPAEHAQLLGRIRASV